jgi:C_GCAxxG_C_C family probable redox protein
MSGVETAVRLFDGGYSCSQAVFTAFADQLGVRPETAARIAAGFGGGMGRLGETCGAVTGALMVLGARYGGTDIVAKEETYEMVRVFMDRFNARHGITVCRDLLHCDISTPEGRAEAHEKDLHGSICSNLVRDAAEILEAML